MLVDLPPAVVVAVVGLMLELCMLEWSTNPSFLVGGRSSPARLPVAFPRIAPTLDEGLRVQASSERVGQSASPPRCRRRILLQSKDVLCEGASKLSMLDHHRLRDLPGPPALVLLGRQLTLQAVVL